MADQTVAPVIRYADETGDYRSRLIVYLDDLTVIYESLISKMMHGGYDDETVNLTVAKMVTIMGHLMPKLEGGGPKTASLLKEFEPFKPWLSEVCKPKVDAGEADKIPVLFQLILKAYHLLNISNY